MFYIQGKQCFSFINGELNYEYIEILELIVKELELDYRKIKYKKESNGIKFHVKLFYTTTDCCKIRLSN